MTQERQQDALLRPPYPVGWDADDLTVGQGIVDLKQMRHVVTDQYHPIAIRTEHLTAVLHHGGLLAEIDQGIDTLLVRDLRITSHLKVTDMGTQHHKARLLFAQMIVMLKALRLHQELLASIHGETVNHHLCKHAVVLVGHPPGSQGTIAKTFAEEAVHVAVALSEEHAGRHDEDIGKDIEQTDIQQTQHGYQTTMHRARAKGCSCPLFLT